jgi:hypothetical protein
VSSASRMFPVDFPLDISIADLQNIRGSFEEFLNTMQNDGELGMQIEANGIGSGNSGAVSMGAPVPVSSGHMQQTLAQPQRRRSRWAPSPPPPPLPPPAITLVAVLEPTTYKEEKDKTQRSLGYIGAQSKYLHHL